ncbi:VOC family protein [Mesonia sp.]|uniref:VOC family protein n=1 Tax=Mesonia sp. TaxID=1960830 RepID=UPI001776A714|nr:VOC family protein [Mesonia sp.]HIB37782.1 VOC family protein [Mesonia sp.]HIO26797.1 VOC family protein [Flavobacteriaceae bacterium]
MAQIHTYLTFEGNCEEAFNFYKSVFKKEFEYVGKFKDMPSETPVPDSEKDKIMHISLPINEYTKLMGSDTMEGFGPKITKGNNYSISVNADSKKEAEEIFEALSANGNITMKLEKTFWAALFGMCIDKFGINWMVNYDEQ